jgi:hypothetical protein
VVGFSEHGNEPPGSKAGNFLTSRVIISFSRRTLHHGVSYCPDSIIIKKYNSNYEICN